MLLAFATTGGDVMAQEDAPMTTGAQGARWIDGVITLSVEPTMDALGDGSLEALVGAVSAWQTLPALLPTMVVERSSLQKVGYFPKQANFNTVRYAADGDPMANGALAITIITFDTEAQQILDADIVVNGEHRFGVVADVAATPAGIYDLQNVLTHELGHLLGLGENFEDKHATMYAYSLPLETEKRDLGDPDVSSVSTLYDSLPPEESALAGCGGATVSRSKAGDQAWYWGLLGVVLAVGAARRRAFRQAALFSTGFLLAAMATGVERELAVTETALLPGAQLVQATRVVADAEPIHALVLGADTRWDDGLIVTSLELDRPACAGSAPACQTRELEVLGGRMGKWEQVVGHALPPSVGSQVALSQLDRFAHEGSALVRGRDGSWLQIRRIDGNGSGH
jgi:hypothetical protein